MATTSTCLPASDTIGRVSYEDERYDRLRDERDRAQANEQGWRAVGQGNSLAAIRAFAGAEAAMYYAGAMDDSQPWPLYVRPEDLDDFVANLRALPEPADLRINRVEDGEAEIEAVAQSTGTTLGKFWAPLPIVEEYRARYGA